MLLQIQEPSSSESLPPREFKLALGIDLGTTNSVAAAVGDDGAPKVFCDEDGRALVPSAVHYAADSAPLVGEAAMAKRRDDPENVICSVKRFMGREAAEVRDDYRYAFAEGGGMAKLQTAAGDKSPVEVSAEILRFLRHRAEAAAGMEAAGAVIATPAYFDEAQRQATKDAAELAGLKVLRLLSEPTAAAVAYGLDNAEEGAYLIYDLGGGTFDASLLRMEKGVFTVLATGGNTSLGGDDYDRALAEVAEKKIGRAKNKNFRRPVAMDCRRPRIPRNIVAARQGDNAGGIGKRRGGMRSERGGVGGGDFRINGGDHCLLQKNAVGRGDDSGGHSGDGAGGRGDSDAGD